MERCFCEEDCSLLFCGAGFTATYTGELGAGEPFGEWRGV
jgi:hypothetical protein